MINCFAGLLICLCALVSALAFIIPYYIESVRQKSVRKKFFDKDSPVLKSITEFQRVAHDFPSNPDECETGQLFVTDNDVFLKTDDSYVKLAEESTHSHLPTNCVNCGAPLHGHICKYCDTEYN